MLNNNSDRYHDNDSNNFAAPMDQKRLKNNTKNTPSEFIEVLMVDTSEEKKDYIEMMTNDPHLLLSETDEPVEDIMTTEVPEMEGKSKLKNKEESTEEYQESLQLKSSADSSSKLLPGEFANLMLEENITIEGNINSKRVLNDESTANNTSITHSSKERDDSFSLEMPHIDPIKKFIDGLVDQVSLSNDFSSNKPLKIIVGSMEVGENNITKNTISGKIA